MILGIDRILFFAIMVYGYPEEDNHKTSCNNQPEGGDIYNLMKGDQVLQG